MTDIALDDRTWNVSPNDFDGIVESKIREFMTKALEKTDKVNILMGGFRESGKYTWLKDYIIPQLLRQKSTSNYSISSDIETFSYANNMLSGNLKGSPENWEI